MDNWLTRMFGGEPANKLLDVPKRPAGWVSSDELNESKKYDRSYGDPSAGFFQPGAKVRMPDNLGAWINAYNKEALGGAGYKAIDQTTADSLHTAWAAAQSTAIAALGYDPSRLVTLPAAATKDRTATIAGAYSPKKDELYTTGEYASTMVHESIHRGIQKLREAGRLPESATRVDNETLTRAFMSKYYGDVEKGRGGLADEQVRAGELIQKSNPGYVKMMGDVEAAAAQLSYEKRPRGPR